MDNILIDTVPAHTLEVGDIVEVDGYHCTINLIDEIAPGMFLLVMEDDDFLGEAGEVLCSYDEMFDVYGPAVVVI